MPTPLKIGLVGFGNIGTGVVRHLADFGDVINARLPRPIVLSRVADADLSRDRGVPTDGITMSSDFKDIVADPEIEVVIELVGGTTIANTIVRAALSAGKHVVTANKALIATYGAELFELARENNAHLLFEASVGAGIPIIRAMQTGIQSNRIDAVRGILNGTCNYILSAMEDTPGTEYATVLQEAMRLGYAEPDPTLDVEGNDTAHKIAILGSLAFGADLRAGNVVLGGITRIGVEDIEWAQANGQTIKLLAAAERDSEGRPALSVWPTFVPRDHPIGGVRGVINTVWVEGQPIGSTMYTGPGAGQGSTSSGVLSDVMLVAQAGDSTVLAGLNPLNGVTTGATDLAPEYHPERYLRVRTEASDKVAAELGLAVIDRGEKRVVFRAPAQTGVERGEMLARLTALGVAHEDISEIRYALQSA